MASYEGLLHTSILHSEAVETCVLVRLCLKGVHMRSLRQSSTELTTSTCGVSVTHNLLASDQSLPERFGLVAKAQLISCLRPSSSASSAAV